MYYMRYMFVLHEVHVRTTCGNNVVCYTAVCELLMQGKCIHPKQPVVFKEKTELPWAGFKPATSCVLDWCSTN